MNIKLESTCRFPLKAAGAFALEKMSLSHKAVVVECSAGTADLAKEIEKKADEMLNKGYQLITMSMVGTTRAILVFKL